MSKPKIVGMITIGESPRDDLVPEIKRLAGLEAEILQCGTLDGLSRSEMTKLAPEHGEYELVTRLKDGTEIRLARRKLVNRMQNCIDSLEERGADVIVILCVGEWPGFRSEKLVIEPFAPFRGLMLGMVNKGDRLGIIVPAEAQIEGFKQGWSKQGVKLSVAAASPYGPTARDDLARAARSLKESGVDVVAMACPGFDEEMRGIVEEITGKPAVLVLSVLAWMVKELAG
ncbi:AroM family protein [Chloroflexota bacterium]